jgi:hypothetical protein
MIPSFFMRFLLFDDRPCPARGFLPRHLRGPTGERGTSGAPGLPNNIEVLAGFLALNLWIGQDFDPVRPDFKGRPDFSIDHRIGKMPWSRKSIQVV